LRYSCGHVSTKKNVRGIKDAATSTPPQLRSSRYIRYRDNIGYPRYGERYDIGDNQYSSNNLSYCPINRFLELIMNLTSNRMHGEFLCLLFLQAHQETEVHFTAAGMPSQRNQSESFRFKRAAFYQGLKSKVGLAAAKAAALRINLNVQGCSIVAAPMHAPSRTSLLLPLLLSHNLPLPRVH
jgi:hypothetical protein